MSFGYAPLVIIALSLLMVMLGAWILLRQQWLLQWLKGTAGLILLGTGIYFVLFAVNLYGYTQLDNEEPVATVSFQRTSGQSYLATITRADGTVEDFHLNGDQWQIDARVVKWSAPFAMLGLEPGYQLDRIQGRYYALEDERSRKRTVYSLYQKPIGIDIWKMAREGWSFIVDARYGSAAYLPMADGAIFEVTASHSGLVGRPLNSSAEQALAGWD